MNELVRRQQATFATLQRYRGRALDWQAAITCVHMARFHLRQLGHRPPALPRIRSFIAARHALTARGWSDCAQMLDAQPWLAQIAPAAMLPGDLAFRASEDGLGSILICAGAQKAMGWFEGADGMVVMDMNFGQFAAAWRA